ncbi:uncharacterized protein FIBRA_09272 [Fibroporia radiculosa]|uniref:F-box domain-containing protein n=1 Tax=Fibroporia radiculosa TaxID=599839 RepID=J7SCW0_9APHY|nr:uncharacterized protein FIBRA_09272 [Fibroporia radiculosa]CCM06958.1 predicted protein [Fibroporia radiculosa]
MNVAIACSPEDVHSVADRDELENVTTVEAGEYPLSAARRFVEWSAEQNVRRSCWDASVAERTVSQLCDICPVVSSRLPTELWERIIDFITDYRLYDMRQLGQVGRGWYARCRFHSHKVLEMGNMEKKQVYRLIKTLDEPPKRCRAIETVLFDFELKPIGHFGSFAVRMVQKLPRVEFLKLWHCKWETGQLHTQVFLHVALTFGSVIKLELYDVMFPSAVVFGRLLRALPRLSTLNCLVVDFKKGCRGVGAVRVPGTLRLDAAELDGSGDVFDFLASIKVHLRHLICYGNDLEKVPELLAVTAESLLSLEVRQLHKANSVNLTPAVNLRVLAIDGVLKDMAMAFWILSRASLPKLVEVTIKSSLTDRPTAVSIQDILNSIDDDFDDSFAQMDHSLSGSQFPALRKVTFLLCYGIQFSHAPNNISEGSWRTLLSSKLPALYASGRFLAEVPTLRVW